MKISNDLPPPEFDPKNKQVQDDAKKVGSVDASQRQGDSQVKLSGRAQELVNLSKLAEQVPEAQSGRVEAIRLAVAESRYPLSAEHLADSILKSLSHHPEGL